MAGYDFRKQPETTNRLSFYIFDNLKMQESGEGGNVYRFDTMQEAIIGFRMIQAEHNWTIALGGSVGGEHEIDFIQRRNGANVLIDDFMRIEFWKDRSDVAQAIEEFASGPGIEWQTDRKLFGNPVLVPYAPEGAHDDPVLADKALLPASLGNTLTGIAEVYMEGKGWISFDEAQKAVKERFSGSTEYPKVTRLNVAYERMDGGPAGYIDIKPSELDGMVDRFHEMSNIRDRRWEERLAAESEGSQPVSENDLPDTGKPFFNYDTSYGETEKINIEIATYEANDNLYVGMSYYDPELGGMDDYGDITVNIIKLSPFLAAIDTNNNGEKIMNFLTENGFGEPTGGALPSGFCLFPIFRFNEDKLREVDPLGFERHCREVGIQPMNQEASLDELKKQAKERAHEHNSERPEKHQNRTHSQDMEL